MLNFYFIVLFLEPTKFLVYLKIKWFFILKINFNFSNYFESLKRLNDFKTRNNQVCHNMTSETTSKVCCMKTTTLLLPSYTQLQKMVEI